MGDAVIVAFGNVWLEGVVSGGVASCNHVATGKLLAFGTVNFIAVIADSRRHGPLGSSVAREPFVHFGSA
jgi:hypothetical protein